jgi:hypothetical protein
MSRAARSELERRVFRILRQIVGDVEPRRLAGDEAVQRRPRRRIVEQRQRDAVLRRGVLRKFRRRLPVRPVAVDDRRAAFAAKPALIAARAFIEPDQILAVEPAEIFRLHANAAAKRRAMLLAALRAMAIQRRRQRPGDLELDAAAQAAAGGGGYGALRRLQQRNGGRGRKHRPHRAPRRGDSEVDGLQQRVGRRSRPRRRSQARLIIRENGVYNSRYYSTMKAVMG